MNSSDIFLLAALFLAILLPALGLYSLFTRLTVSTWENTLIYRWYIYAFGFVASYFEYLPIAPYIGFFNTYLVNRLIAFTFVLVLYFLLVFSVSLLFTCTRRSAFKSSLLIELILIPLILCGSMFYLSKPFSNLRNQSLVWLNHDREIEDFINPFPGIAMNDCRKFSKSFDVIFVPARISIKADVLFYRSAKIIESNTNKISPKNDYGAGFTLESQDIMWGDEIMNCMYQSKIR